MTENKTKEKPIVNRGFVYSQTRGRDHLPYDHALGEFTSSHNNLN